MKKENIFLLKKLQEAYISEIHPDVSESLLTKLKGAALSYKLIKMFKHIST